LENYSIKYKKYKKMATKYLSSSVEEQMMISKSIEEKEDRYKED